MSPGHKRQIIVAMVNRGRCTAREACRHFCLHRSTFGYEAKQPDAWMAKLKAALRRMSREHPELGYISPIEFEQKLESESSTQGKSSSWPPASFRPSLDLLYTRNHYITTSRLTV